MIHTKTPWKYSTVPVIESLATFIIGDGSIIARMSESHGLNIEANAQRIVECVNAFEGIEDPKAYMETVNEIMRKGGEAANERDHFKKKFHEAMKLVEELRNSQK